MKKIMYRLTLLMIVMTGFALAGSAQLVVKVRPEAPRVVVTRPAPPSPRHVWVEGGWVERGGRYVWVDGYWVAPRRGYHWVPGHWVARRGGWIWIGGHWVRGRR